MRNQNDQVWTEGPQADTCADCSQVRALPHRQGTRCRRRAEARVAVWFLPPSGTVFWVHIP